MPANGTVSNNETRARLTTSRGQIFTCGNSYDGYLFACRSSEFADIASRYTFRTINRGNSHVAFPRETLSFFLFHFFFFHAGAHEPRELALSRWEPRGIEGGDRPLKPPFENPSALAFALPCLALPCSCLASPRGFDLARFTSRNTGKRRKRRKSHCDLRQ